MTHSAHKERGIRSGLSGREQGAAIPHRRQSWALAVKKDTMKWDPQVVKTLKWNRGQRQPMATATQVMRSSGIATIPGSGLN